MGFLVFREPVNAWTHFSWLLLAFPATWLLWRRARGDLGRQLSLLVFGLSVMVCYGGSTLYHGVRAGHRQILLFQTIDYIGIYVLIAGSYTPAVLTVLQGRWRWGILALVWLMAGVGITLRLAAVPIHPFVSTGLYLAMGWTSVLCYFELARALSHRAMFPVVLGGVLYSIGAVVNMLHWPVLGLTAHQFMHLCVMGGTLAHFWFMLHSVAPYVRPLAAAPAEAPGPEPEPLSPGLAPAETTG